jgi:hypothetical protein
MSNDRSALVKRATVEFLVIVTGILAAFSVDEFREARAIRALEREYAQRIASDLDDAAQNLTAGVQSTRQRADAGRALLAHLSGASPLSPPDLVLGAYEVGLFPIARERRLGRRTTYDELVTTGNLRSIGDAGLRQSLARHYEEYTRIGGRLEDRPPGWRTWAYGLLTPDLLEALRGVEGCFTGLARPGHCLLAIPLEDQDRFVQELEADREYALRELRQVVQYQDRQVSDLIGFSEGTAALLNELTASGLTR